MRLGHNLSYSIPDRQSSCIPATTNRPRYIPC